MGKHSRVRKRPKGARWATALIPVGILAGAATAGADQGPATVSADDAAPAVHTERAAASPTTAPATHRPAVSPVVFDAIDPPTPRSVRGGAVPAANYEAYRAAETTMARTNPGCGIDWKLIAGIGKVESHHADQGAVDAAGSLRQPIYGPRLDGTLAGNQVVPDTDGGRLDGDSAFDRAVGPMQFLPATWAKYAGDGNGDGKADPQNIFDAALTTAHYLCDGRLDLRNAASRVTAVLRYNNSMSYVDSVLGFARSY